MLHQVLQIFESWAHHIGPDDFSEFAKPCVPLPSPDEPPVAIPIPGGYVQHVSRGVPLCLGAWLRCVASRDESVMNKRRRYVHVRLRDGHVIDANPG